MKKVITFIMLFVALFLVISPVTALAAEIADEVSGGESTYQDIFTRVWEYVQANKTELVSAAGSAVVLIFNAVTKAVNTKKNRELADALAIVGSDAAGTVKSQASVISAVNTMASGYNEMRTAYEKYETVEDDRNRLVGACLVTNTAILEILNTVYVHNRNLPQGVKDLIVLQYVNCQKALSDDDMLRQVVESVKANLNGTVKDEKAVVENEKQD
jgi:hypothetical protein